MLISKKKFSGEFKIISSKPISQRALILGRFLDNFTYENLSNASDIRVLKNALDQLDDTKIYLGESAFSLRVLGVLLSFLKDRQCFEIVGSLLKRPIDDLLNFYKYNNISYNLKTENNKMTICFTGTIRSIDTFKVDTNISSQVLSGVLFLSLLKSTPYTVKFDKLPSREYIKLSIKILSLVGVNIEQKDNRFIIYPPRLYRETHLAIETDWNLASFFLGAGALFGDIKVFSLKENSIQASSIFLNLLRKVGAEIIADKNFIETRKSVLFSFNFSVEDYPDLFFPVLFLAIFISGKNIISGIARLNYKESRRLDRGIDILNFLNVRYELKKDSLIVYGRELVNFDNNIFIDLYCANDHRYCIFLSFLAGVFGGKLSGIDSVKKSFPNFFTLFEEIY